MIYGFIEIYMYFYLYIYFMALTRDARLNLVDICNKMNNGVCIGQFLLARMLMNI